MAIEEEPGRRAHGGRQAGRDHIGRRQQRLAFPAGDEGQASATGPLDLGVGRAATAVEHLLQPRPDYVPSRYELAGRQLPHQCDGAGARDQGSVKVEHRDAGYRGVQAPMPAATNLRWRRHHVTVPTSRVEKAAGR